MSPKERRFLVLKLGFIVLIFFYVRVESKCYQGCNLALASYYVEQGANLTFISKLLSTSVEEIRSFNPQVSNIYFLRSHTRLNVPFRCDCLNSESLGQVFQYSVKSGDNYSTVAGIYYKNLTTEQLLQSSNGYEPNRIPAGTRLNVTVSCSCGNSSVKKKYRLFVTYPIHPGENLSSIAEESGLPAPMLQSYNPNSDFRSGVVFIPGKDRNGKYPPLKSSTSGISSKVIAGISVGGVSGSLFLAFCLYVGLSKRKKVVDASFLLEAPEVHYIDQPGHGITVDISVEFSYEELAKATDNFNIVNKIGQGGLGTVYYAELRGERTAIKKMDMQASKQFLAELKVLTHVDHLNLVRLIGFCVEGSLFLVYEFIENGNLSQHLRGREPLSWSTRVQIALDSARGLEYIHEHTVPVYIHRDIKSANILIDKNYRGKVADFGLTTLTGSASLQTQLVGTFGYMPPEYAQYCDVSPKVDVYAFGVVMYELISAKGAIVKTNELLTEPRGLVALFEDVFNQPDSRDDLCKLVDPRLEDNYPIDSVRKMAQLARACTHENPQLRPSMRSIVVALMTLSSSTEDWDVGSFYENQARSSQSNVRKVVCKTDMLVGDV